MKLSQFNFDLPQERIAKEPTRWRDECKLMVLHKDSGEIEHRLFKDILDYFHKGDRFVFNDTKVFPAKLFGKKEKTGADIMVEPGESETIRFALMTRVKTVNGESPDDNGNVQVQHALTADNLTSSASQNNVASFVRRTSGGSASISTGDAWLSTLRGNRTHIGFVPEQLNMTVNAAPREEGETPITATIDRDRGMPTLDRPKIQQPMRICVQLV